jgi:hypothetical protein
MIGLRCTVFVQLSTRVRTACGAEATKVRGRWISVGDTKLSVANNVMLVLLDKTSVSKVMILGM